MKKIFLVIVYIFVCIVGMHAQKSGWIASVDYRNSCHSHERFDFHSHEFRLGGGYNIQLPFVGLFVRPKAALNVQWGHDAPSDKYNPSIKGHSFTSMGLGVDVFAGYKLWRYLELYTGPGLEWFFYNHEGRYFGLDSKDVFSFWTFGASVPIRSVSIDLGFNLHMNKPVSDFQSNRISIGVSYRF